MKIYDISQTVCEGIAVWPGDRPFSCRQTMRIGRGDPCNVSALTMSVHTGTHLDAPFHFDDNGEDITRVTIEHYLGPARVVEIAAENCITAVDLERLDLSGVKRILFKTRASDVPEHQFDPGFTYLAENAAELLGRQKILLVGTDAPSVDPFRSRTLSTHKALLAHEVAILEGVRLAEVPAGDYELICLPLKLAGLDGSPVRAILRS